MWGRVHESWVISAILVVFDKTQVIHGAADIFGVLQRFRRHDPRGLKPHGFGYRIDSTHSNLGCTDDDQGRLRGITRQYSTRDLEHPFFIFVPHAGIPIEGENGLSQTFDE